MLSLPTPADCAECHTIADLHALGNVCWICHWPAVHNDEPNAAVYGPQVPLITKLPAGTAGGGSTNAPTTTTTTDDPSTDPNRPTCPTPAPRSA